jgi:predicted HTH domain antitoxin
VSVVVNLPAHLEKRLRDEFPQLDRHILEGYAVEAFRTGELSSGQVGELLGMSSRWEAMAFLSDRGAYPGYDLGDLEDDLRQVGPAAEAPGL